MEKRLFKKEKYDAKLKEVMKDMENIIEGTTDGFVYLTQNLYTAYYYGNILLLDQDDYNKKYVYIFKIEIPDDNILLEPDFDELKVRNKVYSKNIYMERMFRNVRLCKNKTGYYY